MTKLTKVLCTSMCVGLALCGAELSAANKADDEGSRRVLQQRLDEARKRLEAAAREVAELSVALSDTMVRLPPLSSLAYTPRAALGILLGTDRDKHDDGVEIMSVSPGGAAAEAGLRAGDVLIEIDGKSLAREGMQDPHDKLLSYMRTVEPDQKVRLRYRRDGRTHEVELVARPMRNRFVIPPQLEHNASTLLGWLQDGVFYRAEGVFGSAELVAMTPKLGQYFGTDKGLLVVRAPADSRLKLEEGDVILDIDGRVPTSPSHAFRILSSYQPGEKLKLNVMRQKKRLTFDVVIPDEPVKRSRFELRHHRPVEPHAPMRMPTPARAIVSVNTV